MSPFALLICLGCFAAATLQLLHYLPLLPEKMIIRFDMDGQPNGWMDKDAFAPYYVLLLSGVTGIFVLFGLLTPTLPARMMRIPSAAYWLAPERRAETLKYMREFYLWSGAFAGLFIVAMMEMVFKINLSAAPQLDNYLFYTALGIFSAACLLATALVFWRFRKPADTA